MSTSLFGPSHSLRVARLYRQALGEARSWCVTFELYREKCLEIRERFDNNKNITNKKQVDRILADTEAELHKIQHPQPYIFPTAPGGSKYERNIPPHLDLCKMKASEYEWYYGVPPPEGYSPTREHE
eukprot:CFRG7674T1